ncbi:uncharacterized protein AMSG_02852 [Thecamonas trahens ATCC 50062]|uniref:Uncharacterized protein n=1 Tax=Thecamonas trahens ATCC 50062 TaxID=461836 RepID=A0A0L0D521_THETB|nr:hypothetical protein AMSG_02852 [Thecamonas trahens ATCC 50062]KNC46398.1 hypothetical protein AMSG_02852 [Thecamonas trahens ATCC 50062]|eukprot:XP_013760691.1 hypothetical protein AMSG_02852 [Thecamonas trahens ATCC 50062]
MESHDEVCAAHAHVLAAGLGVIGDEPPSDAAGHELTFAALEGMDALARLAVRGDNASTGLSRFDDRYGAFRSLPERLPAPLIGAQLAVGVTHLLAFDHNYAASPLFVSLAVIAGSCAAARAMADPTTPAGSDASRLAALIIPWLSTAPRHLVAAAGVCRAWRAEAKRAAHWPDFSSLDSWRARAELALVLRSEGRGDAESESVVVGYMLSVAVPPRPPAFAVVPPEMASAIFLFLHSPSVGSLHAVLSATHAVVVSGARDAVSADAVALLVSLVSFDLLVGAGAAFGIRLVRKRRESSNGNGGAFVRDGVAVLSAVLEPRIRLRPWEAWWLRRAMARIRAGVTAGSASSRSLGETLLQPGSLPLAVSLRETLVGMWIQGEREGGASTRHFLAHTLEMWASDETRPAFNGEKQLKALDDTPVSLVNHLPLAQFDQPLLGPPVLAALAKLVLAHEAHVGSKFFPFINSEARYAALLSQIDIEGGSLAQLYGIMLDSSGSSSSDWPALTPQLVALAKAGECEPAWAAVLRIHDVLVGRTQLALAAAGIKRPSAWSSTLQLARAALHVSGGMARAGQSSRTESRPLAVAFELSLLRLSFAGVCMPASIDGFETNLGWLAASYVREAVAVLVAIGQYRLADLLRAVFGIGWVSDQRAPGAPGGASVINWSAPGALVQAYHGLECVVSIVVESVAPSFVPTWRAVQDVDMTPAVTEGLFRSGLFAALAPSERSMIPVLTLLLATRVVLAASLVLDLLAVANVGHAYVHVLHVKQLVGFRLLASSNALVHGGSARLADDVPLLSLTFEVLNDPGLRTVMSHTREVFAFHEAPYTMATLAHRRHVLYERIIGDDLSVSTPVAELLDLRARWQASYSRVLSEKEVLDEVLEDPALLNRLGWTADAVADKTHAAFNLLETLELERAAIDSLVCFALVQQLTDELCQAWPMEADDSSFCTALDALNAYMTSLYAHGTTPLLASSRAPPLAALVEEADDAVGAFCRLSSSAVNAAAEAGELGDATLFKNYIRVVAALVCVIAADSLAGLRLAAAEGEGDSPDAQLEVFAILGKLFRQAWFYWASGGRLAAGPNELLEVFETWMWEFHDLEELGIVWNTLYHAESDLGSAIARSAVRTADDVLESLGERAEAVAKLASYAGESQAPHAELLAQAQALTAPSSESVHSTPLRAQVALEAPEVQDDLELMLERLATRDAALIQRQRRRRVYIRHMAGVLTSDRPLSLRLLAAS